MSQLSDLDFLAVNVPDYADYKYVHRAAYGYKFSRAGNGRSYSKSVVDDRRKELINRAEVATEQIFTGATGRPEHREAQDRYNKQLRDRVDALAMRPDPAIEPVVATKAVEVGATYEIAASTPYLNIGYPEGTKVKIYSIFVDDRGVELAAFVCTKGKIGGVATPECFRLILTEEDKAVEEMSRLSFSRMTKEEIDQDKDFCRRLYKAGYIKPNNDGLRRPDSDGELMGNQ